MKLYQFMLQNAVLLNAIAVSFVVLWGIYRMIANRLLKKKEQANERSDNGVDSDDFNGGND